MLLVSFCNRTDATGRVLAAIDSGGEVRRWFDLAAHAPASACGIAYSGDTLYCACSDAGGSYIAVFDASATLRDYVSLSNVGDIHSICTDGTSLFAASTGTDEIVRLPLSNLSAPGEVLWRASSLGRDENHVNCVAFVQGRLLCGGFGPKNGPAWADAYDGFIYDLNAATFLARGLFHPHTLIEHEGQMYFCESAEGSMRTLQSALRYVVGYSRGLAFEARTFYLGVSCGRRSNARARYVFNPADPGARYGNCAIYVGALENPAQARTIDLSFAGEEIYDVCALPEAMNAAI